MKTLLKAKGRESRSKGRRKKGGRGEGGGSSQGRTAIPSRHRLGEALKPQSHTSQGLRPTTAISKQSQPWGKGNHCVCQGRCAVKGGGSAAHVVWLQPTRCLGEGGMGHVPPRSLHEAASESWHSRLMPKGTHLLHLLFPFQFCLLLWNETGFQEVRSTPHQGARVKQGGITWSQPTGQGC